MKKLIQTLVLVLPIVLSACGKGGGSSSSGSAQVPPSVIGQDISGSYLNAGIECFNSAGSTLEASATYSSGSPSDTLVVSGNSFTETYVAASCSVAMSGTIQLTESTSSSSGQTGSFSETFSSVSVTGGSSCALNFSLVPTSGSPSISPSTLSATVTNGQSESPITGATYLYTSTQIFAVYTTLAVSGQPSDLCFMIYNHI